MDVRMEFTAYVYIKPKSTNSTYHAAVVPTIFLRPHSVAVYLNDPAKSRASCMRCVLRSRGAVHRQGKGGLL